MNAQKIFLLTMVIGTLIGCTANQSDSKNNSTQGLTMKSTNQEDLKQTQEKSTHAKKIIHHHADIKNVLAVNANDKLVLAIEVPHMKRFRLKQIEQQVTEQMKQEFPNTTVQVSTDQKIILELEKLEDKLNSQTITKKELNKMLTKIMKLMKENT